MRNREKDDKFKGSLSEGMKAEQDESDEDVWVHKRFTHFGLQFNIIALVTLAKGD